MGNHTSDEQKSNQKPIFGGFDHEKHMYCVNFLIDLRSNSLFGEGSQSHLPHFI